MNVIVCIALALLALWGISFCFLTLDVNEGLLGYGFGGLFFVMVLYAIAVAIRDFTGRNKEEGE